MRNLLFFCSLFLFFSFTSYSQRQQVSAGVGIASSTQILDGFLEVGSNLFTFGFFDTPRITNTRNIGEIRVSYAYFPQERWSFGGTLSYNHSDSDVFYKEDKIGDRNNNFYTLAAETSFSFLNKEKVKLYALLGAGVTYASITETSYDPSETSDFSGALFNFHVTPLGIQIGNKWGGFAEAGFGYRGIVSAGMFYNL